MKLEEIKAKIDSYFDNISEEEFFELITTTYSMPVVYEMDLPFVSSAFDDIIPADFDEIDYRETYTCSGDFSTVKITSQPFCELMSNDSTCVSHTLSYAA